MSNRSAHDLADNPSERTHFILQDAIGNAIEAAIAEGAETIAEQLNVLLAHIRAKNYRHFRH
jgi:hypothetical protein